MLSDRDLNLILCLERCVHAFTLSFVVAGTAKRPANRPHQHLRLPASRQLASRLLCAFPQLCVRLREERQQDVVVLLRLRKVPASLRSNDTSIPSGSWINHQEPSNCSAAQSSRVAASRCAHQQRFGEPAAGLRELFIHPQRPLRRYGSKRMVALHQRGVSGVRKRSPVHLYRIATIMPCLCAWKPSTICMHHSPVSQT